MNALVEPTVVKNESGNLYICPMFLYVKPNITSNTKVFCLPLTHIHC